jgi:hypothetical protein
MKKVLIIQTVNILLNFSNRKETDISIRMICNSANLWNCGILILIPIDIKVQKYLHTNRQLPEFKL